MKEIEIKILEIHLHKTKAKLKLSGAEKTSKEGMLAYYYDRNDGSLKKSGEILRLRSSGNRIFLTYKKKIPDLHAKVCNENEIQVNSFESTDLLLRQLGFSVILKIRKIRHSYRLRNIHIELDIFLDDHSYIPPLLELESDNYDDLMTALNELDYTIHDTVTFNTFELIQHYANKKHQK